MMIILIEMSHPDMCFSSICNYTVQALSGGVLPVSAVLADDEVFFNIFFFQYLFFQYQKDVIIHHTKKTLPKAQETQDMSVFAKLSAQTIKTS